MRFMLPLLSLLVVGCTGRNSIDLPANSSTPRTQPPSQTVTVVSTDGFFGLCNLHDLMLSYVKETPNGFAITYDPSDDTCFDFRVGKDD